jgi:tetratricopeptide (TPR) repeat protein
LYHLGLACVQLGDLSEGARHWQTALLQHDDDGLRSDLAWLHVRLADAAAAAGRRAEMTQHWNTALELLPDVRPALVNRWAAEAWRRLRHPDSLQPTSRDFEIAHDLMEEVLAFNPDMPQYRLLAGLCAARIGDWPFAEELVEPLSHKGQWAATASYCVGLCLWERNLHDAALTTLSLHRDWERWETAVQAFRTQIYLASEDVERTVRELAMLRALAPDVCTADAAASVLLHLRCWRNAYELAQEVSFAERSDLVRYALGTAALMMRRETEGLEGLEQVSPASPWHAAARELRRTGYKRRALRALQTLGWEEVVRSLEEILRLDEEDETIRAWMDRAQDFAMLMRREGDAGAALAARWRARLRQDPRDVLPLHQWAVHAYWDAQQEPTPDRWRLAMSLWGTLLNLESYWMEWARARLRRHDPGTWQKDSEDGHLEAQVRSVVVDLRRRHMVSLISEMTDAVLGDETTAAALDDLVLDFLREFETAGHWRDWLTTRADLADAVLPYGGDLLETLHRMQDSRDVLTATENVQPTPLGERLLIYLSSLGSLLAAAETGNEALARERAQEYFDSTDPTERRYARVIFVLATRQAKDLAQHPRDGLEIALRAFAYAREVGDSALLATVDWEALFAQLSDGLVSEVEAHLGLPFEERVEAAAGATDLLRKVHEATNVRALIHAIVRLTLFHVRALQGMGRKGRRAADGEYFTECDAEALDRIQEALLLAPDHVTMQQEAAQLRLRRGLVALQEDRLNEAMIDLARAHELDPVSHRIAAAYTHLLMEQATRLWEERRDDASREAMTLAHRVLATNPTDAQLLVRCSRFLDVPEGHALREAPEYRRLASLYMRQAREEE